MSTKTQTTPSSFSRLRLGFRQKPRPRPQEEPEEEDDWYIPYNGPYEIPGDVAALRDRDSWGQLLSTAGGVSGEGRREEDSEGVGPHRSRAVSDVHANRRSRPSHINTTLSPTLGGVGESPMPVQRFQDHPPPPSSHRLSFASFLTFGTVSRRHSPAPAPRSSRPSSPSTSSMPPPPPPTRQTTVKRGRTAVEPLQINRAADDELYDTYYSTLVSTPAMPRQRANTIAEPAHSDTSSPHPYAYPFPSPLVIDAPRRAPTVAPSAYKGKGVDRTFNYPSPPALQSIGRNSLSKAISTPNLRAFTRSNAPSPSAKSPALRPSKQRWLSPETWCDALLFPRPRFTIHIESEPAVRTPPRSASVRATSPAIAWNSNSRDDSPVITERQTVDGRNGSGPLRLLAKSRSAMNLSSVAGPSHGPPEGDPTMLMPKSGRERPRSFAQDDLALPSPVPSLARVLEAGDTLKRERELWNSQAAKSFQNKRTRSVGRGRSKSVGHRARLKDIGNIDFLAARTLLGSQAVAPTVHIAGPFAVVDTGAHTKSIFGTLSSHSHSKSHTHTNSFGQSVSDGRGHSRTGSGVKSALKTAAGFCITDEQMSPVLDDKKIPFDGLLPHETRVVRLEEQMLQEKRAFNGVQVLSTPSAALAHVRDDHGQTGPSPSLSGFTGEGDGAQVGIAISSPPPPSDDHSEDMDPITLPDHPYAQRGFSAPYQPAHRHQRSASAQHPGSDYAGPHLSAPAVTVQPVVMANDFSARHRLPPHATLHPYAMAYASSAQGEQPSAADGPAPSNLVSHFHRPSGGRNIPSSQVPTHGIGPSTHAYAAGNRCSGEPLGLGDAMSYVLRRRGSADSGLGDSDEHGDDQIDAPVNAYVAQNNVTPRREGRPQFIHSNTQASSQSNHTVASSPPDTVNPQYFRVSTSTMHATRGSSSEGVTSSSSSPQHSPRPFSSLEDLDRYRNLFYKPSSRSPPTERRGVVASRDPSGNIPIDVASRTSNAGSGLMNLTRQLSEELEALQDEAAASRASEDSPFYMWGRRYGGLRGGDQSLESRTDPNQVLSMSSQSDSPNTTTLPLRLHRGASPPNADPPIINVPEDIASSRASSMLERLPLDGIDHDQLLRMGTVEAVLTPAATNVDQRFSGHLSIVGDVGMRQSEDGDAGGDDSALRPRVTSTNSLIPTQSAHTEMTRSSYMTNGTDISRMSGLSEFPAPPEQLVVSQDHVGLLQSYFGDVPRAEGEGHIVGSVRPRPPMLMLDSSRRTTFGDQSDASRYSTSDT